jgi:hypothetical protein
MPSVAPDGGIAALVPPACTATLDPVLQILCPVWSVAAQSIAARTGATVGGLPSVDRWYSNVDPAVESSIATEAQNRGRSGLEESNVLQARRTLPTFVFYTYFCICFSPHGHKILPSLPCLRRR